MVETEQGQRDDPPLVQMEQSRTSTNHANNRAKHNRAEQPELPGLLIRVRRWVIDRDSARLQPRDRDYRYFPPGLQRRPPGRSSQLR